MDLGIYVKHLARNTADFSEMSDHFYKRTKFHIDLVKKYCERISNEFEGSDEILERGENHDLSKFEEEELIPYVYLTWRYKCKDEGVEFVTSEELEEAIHKATEHHVLNNRHHPEFHSSRKEEIINREDRDAPPKEIIDATSMSALDIAELVADWCAMSEERGNTPKDWANKNIDVRWKFDETQQAFIYDLIDAIWEDLKWLG
jgi:hypothetical protein